MANDRPAADWRSPESYLWLHACGRHAFAWEWLRRSPAYRDAVAAGAADTPPQHFGLHCFEPWERDAEAARPIWTGQADPCVLTATAISSPDDLDAFDHGSIDVLISRVTSLDGREHWLLSDGHRHIRIDITEGTLARGPVRLSLRIDGLHRAAQQVLGLQRLIALSRTGRFPAGLFPAEQRARRWAMILRVHDALCDGASQREIAQELFGLHDLRRWRIEAASYRRRVQRLVEAARISARTDPRLWLRGQFP